MSLSKLLAGRKRDSFAWEYFTYDEVSDKSVCHASIGKDKLCQSSFKGKNTSNLVAHLQRFHKPEYEEYMERENEKKCLKSGVKRPASATQELDGKRYKNQTLQSCIQRRIVTWPTDSVEHKERLKGVMNMVVATNSPLTLLDNSAFRDMINKLDPKFHTPGINQSSLLKELCASFCIKRSITVVLYNEEI
jgi:hypothetical protein